MTDDLALNDARLYSQINFAMNSARIIRSLTENRKYNSTERQLVTNCISEIALCCVKLWDTDSRSYSIRRYTEIHSESIKDKDEKLNELDLLAKKHKKAIKSLRTFRNKQIAHLDSMSREDFMSFSSDLKDIQAMLHDITTYLNSLPWLEDKELLGGFLTYDQIKSELRL